MIPPPPYIYMTGVFEAGDRWAKKWAGFAKKFDWFGFLVYDSFFN